MRRSAIWEPTSRRRFKLFLAEGALHKPKLAETIGAEEPEDGEGDGEQDVACQAKAKGATNPDGIARVRAAAKKAPRINAKALRAAARAVQGRKSKSKAEKATLAATPVGPMSGCCVCVRKFCLLHCEGR